MIKQALRVWMLAGILAPLAPASLANAYHTQIQGDPTHSQVLQQWFEVAQSAAQSGRYEDAKKIYMAIFNASRSPRVLLDYAKVLFAQGEWVEAKKIFVAAYNSPHVPDNAKGIIKWHLSEIDKRLPQVGVSVSFISDSNPANFTHHKRVDVLGQTLTVVAPSSADKAYGVGVNAFVSKPLMGSDTWQGKIKAGAKQFEEASLNTRSLGLGISYQPEGALKQVWSAEADRIFRRASTDYDQYVLGFQATPNTEKRTTISTTLMARRFDQKSANTEQLTIGATQMFPLNQHWLARAELKVARQSAQLDYNSSNEASLGATTYRSLGQVHFAPSAHLAVRRFDDSNPFFGKVREDKRTKLGVSISIGQKKYEAWRPKLSVFYENQDSNLAYYDYNKTYAELSLEY